MQGRLDSAPRLSNRAASCTHLAAASKLSRLMSSLSRSVAESREKRPVAPMFQLQAERDGLGSFTAPSAASKGGSNESREMRPVAPMSQLS